MSFPALTALAAAIRSTITAVVELIFCTKQDPQDYVARWELEVETLPTDFVAEWTFESFGAETNGLYNANAFGSATWNVAGIEGDGVTFDGTGDYLTIADAAALKPTVMTVMAWVKGEATALTDTIFQSYSKNVSLNFAGFRLHTNASGDVAIRIASNTGIVADTDYKDVAFGAVADGTWHHVAASYDGTTIKCHYDGVLASTTTYTGGLVYDTTNYVSIATQFLTASRTSSEDFHGTLDAIKLYNYVVSDSEMAALARVVPDSSYSANHGALVGYPTSATGQIGNAMTFDGVDDYISIPNTAALRPTVLTVSAWVKTTATGLILAFHSGDQSAAGTEVSGFFLAVSSGKAMLSIRANTGTTVDVDYKNATGSIDVNDGLWHFLTGTYDNTTASIYVDGVLDNSEAWASGLGYGTANFVSIGHYDTTWAVPQYFFNGSIDDVRLYDRVLSATEITTMFESTTAAAPTDFVAEWRMDNDSSSPVPTGTVRWYKLDDAASPYTDEEGFAAMTGASTANQTGFGDGGTGVLLNGSQFMIANSAVNPWTSDQLTASAWVKTTATSTGTIHANINSVSGTWSGHRIEILASGAFQLLFANNSGGGNGVGYAYAATTATVNDGEYHHVCGTYDGITLRLYIDGVEDTAFATSVGIEYRGASSMRNTIGAIITDDNVVASAYFNGTIDDVKHYNRVITPSEVRAAYAEGAHTRDTTGNHPATMVAVPTFTTGWENNALTLNGTTQYATVVDDAALKPANVTVAAWVKSTNTGTFNWIFQSSNVELAGRSGFELAIKDTGDYQFQVASDTGDVQGTDKEFIATSSTTAYDGQWHHICGTYNGTTMVLYKDGVEEASAAFAGGLAYSATNYARVGARMEDQLSGTETLFFNGSIDKLQVFDRAVTAAEVVAMANYQICVPVEVLFYCNKQVPLDYVARWELEKVSVGGNAPPSDMTVHWEMDESSGNLTDSAGGNTATLVFSPTFSIPAPNGTGLNFVAASSEHFSYATNADFEGSSMSFSFWVKGTALTGVVAAYQRSTGGNLTGWRLDPSVFYVYSNNGSTQGVGWQLLDASTEPNNLKDGNWHHVVASYDGATMKIFMDGTLRKSAAYAGGLAYGNIINPRIGCSNQSGGNGSFLEGSLDDLKIFTRAITDQEVEDLYLTSRIAKDSSYIDHQGLIYGSPLLSAGQIGNAITFDGVDDYIAIPDSAALKPTVLTVSAWVKTTATGYQVVSAVWDHIANTSVGGWNLAITAGIVSLTVGDNADDTINVNYHSAYSAATVNDGNWHHIAGTYDGTTIKIFIDAVPDGSQAFAITLGYASPSFSRIGVREGTINGLEGYFNGSIDDVRLYDRALSTTEITALFESTSVAPPTDFVAEWNMDDDLLDTTGTHPATPIAAPTYTTGWENKALTLNGTTQYATVVQDAALQPTNVSVAAWVKVVETGSTQDIFSNWEHVGGTGFAGYRLNIGGGTGVAFFGIAADNGAGQTTSGVDIDNATGTTVIHDNQWHHVCGTWDDTSKDIKIYVDGVLEDTENFPNGLGYNAANKIAIGSRHDVGSYILHLDGSIDKLQVFDRAVTAAEVVAMANYQICIPTVSPTDYIAYWTMDTADISGATIIDTSTLGTHNATMNNSPTTGEVGKLAEAVLFNGTNQYATAAGSADLKSSEVTLSGWINLANATSSQWIMGNYFNPSGNIGGAFVYIGSTGLVTFGIGKNTGSTLSTDWQVSKSTTEVDDSTWRHICCTFNGTAMLVYVDGTLEGNVTFAETIGYGAINYQLGFRYVAGSPVGYFDGKLDDLKIFDRAITADEVSAMYTADTFAVSPTDMIAHWTMDTAQVSGNDIVELVTGGVGYDLTTYSATMSQTGQVGESILLDSNTSGGAVLGSGLVPALRPANFTISAWVRIDSMVMGESTGTVYWNYDTAIGEGFFIDIAKATGYPRIQVAGNGGTTGIMTGTVSLIDSAWHHICGTYDGTTVEFFIDSVSIGSTAADLTYGVTTSDTNIGGRNGAGSYEINVGYLDDVKLFNRAISAAEVTAMYTADGGT